MDEQRDQAPPVAMPPSPIPRPVVSTVLGALAKAASPVPVAAPSTSTTATSFAVADSTCTAAASAAELSTSADPVSAANTLPPLSKKAAKRAAREAHFQATKHERRAKERANRKLKAARRREEAFLAGEDAGQTQESVAKRARKEARRKWEEVEQSGKGEEGFFRARIVVDLDFDELMTDKEIQSMGSQLGYLYNSHRLAAKPFRSVLLTHLDGRLADRLELIYWKDAKARWLGTEWWDGKRDINELWTGGLIQTAAVEATASVEVVEKKTTTDADPDPILPPSAGLSSGAPPSASASAKTPLPNTFASLASSDTTDTTNAASSAVPSSAPIPIPFAAPSPAAALVGPLPSRSAQDRVVYLTADSDNEINALEEGTTYVIGGIVDRNRYKNLCLDKASRLGIQTARLPIGTYLASMQTRKVLTVNQVFDILLGWVELRDWEAVMTRVMPKRKMEAGGKPAKREKQRALEGSTAGMGAASGSADEREESEDDAGAMVIEEDGDEKDDEEEAMMNA